MTTRCAPVAPIALLIVLVIAWLHPSKTKDDFRIPFTNGRDAS